ncbi:MAG: phosphoenolpyruvate--protein phosphotransferase [Victivallaceae bacterium]|nr:phosphoenolpyruvate--protein phosphotransferase [Victivallaceae bacterium]
MTTKADKQPELRLEGIAAAPGIAIARILILKGSEQEAPEETTIAKSEVAAEQQRFADALNRTRDELIKLRTRLAKEVNAKDAEIFDAHLMIVDDRMLFDEVNKMIAAKHLAADHCFYSVMDHYASAIAAMPDSYIKERAADIRDVTSRVLRNLRASQAATVKLEDDGNFIVLAHDLTPSDTAALDRKKVLGFATEAGSKTSHSAVLARSMLLPALVGLGLHAFSPLKNGDEAVIDGYSGLLIVHPSTETRDFYLRKLEEMNRFLAVLAQESKLRPETQDGYMVQLSSNIESVNDLDMVKMSGSCGVGLFRTEYMFINRDTPPEEDEQFEVYKTLLTGLGDDPLIVRTLDIGGDKLVGSINSYAEDNPFLGLRGIRLCLRARRDLLRTQLRALLRAGVFGNLRVMLPMISCVEEVREVQAIIVELQNELKGERREFVQHLELGVMIETPSAALQVEHLAKVSDFFSIGTNDLIQYTMAIDRGNERVAYLYQPAHPVILDLIWRSAQVARRHNIYVSVCGQAAGDPRLALLLAGLGVHELSMVPANLNPVRRVIRQMTMLEAEQAGQQALQCATSREVMQIANRVLAKVAPEVLSLVSKDEDDV